MLERLKQLFTPGPPVPTLTAPELHKRLKGKQKPYVLDVRSAGEYTGGHIGGSMLVPLGDLEQNLDQLPRNRTIVCVCRSGRRSGKACRKLAAAGFEDVINLEGGMMAWQRARFPVRAPRAGKPQRAPGK